MTQNGVFSREGKRIKVFLSYSDRDKKIAGKIKYELEELGLDIFLAHEDIPPSRNWQKVILEALDKCDVFIPLLSENFRNSYWTDQETGVAVSKEKMLIPVKIDGTDPYGFIGTVQALKIRKERDVKISSSFVTVNWGVKEIFDSLLNMIGPTKLKNILIDGLVQGFVDSKYYDGAKLKSGLLLEYEEYLDESHLNRIVSGATVNSQIYGSYGALNLLPQLISMHKTKVEKENLDKFNNRFKTKI